MEASKNLFESKTFYLNLLMPLFLIINHKYGIQLDDDTEMALAVVFMAIVNIIMRRFTKTPLTILPQELKS